VNTIGPDLVSLKQSVRIARPYGDTVLPVGTKLKFVSRDAAEVHIRYIGTEYAIPISATDLDETPHPSL
jgi:hypothetical protein